MAVRPIRLFGDPVLRDRAAEVVDFDKELRNLVRDLLDTMTQEGGAGLAAPQLGISLRVFTYHCGDGSGGDGSGGDGSGDGGSRNEVTGHLVNPIIEVLGEDMQDGPEGCLSIPRLSWDCRRHLRVVARGQNQHGEPVEVLGTERLARAIQHETDHLDGVLFIDRLDPETRKQAMREIRQARWFGAPAPVVKVSPHPLLGKVR
ncbi:MAG TPA: peptide deformylase [Pseudonocardiaceae bacterium]|nr:peptide deformylase [Pseudonocardiaceae bacterium]